MIWGIHLSPFFIIKCICQKMGYIAIASFFRSFKWSKTIVDHCTRIWGKPLKNHVDVNGQSVKKHSMVIVKWKKNHWKTIDSNGTLQKIHYHPIFVKNGHRWSLLQSFSLQFPPISFSCFLCAILCSFENIDKNSFWENLIFGPPPLVPRFDGLIVAFLERFPHETDSSRLRQSRSTSWDISWWGAHCFSLTSTKM